MHAIRIRAGRYVVSACGASDAWSYAVDFDGLRTLPLDTFRGFVPVFRRGQRFDYLVLDSPDVASGFRVARKMHAQHFTVISLHPIRIVEDIAFLDSLVCSCGMFTGKAGQYWHLPDVSRRGNIGMCVFCYMGVPHPNASRVQLAA